MLGCHRRTGRLFETQGKRSIIFALDHGLTEGPAQIEPPLFPFIEILASKPLQGIILSPGLTRAAGHLIPLNQTIIMQLSAGTRHAQPPYGRGIVRNVQEALRLGAEAVTVQTFIGNDLEERQLSDLGMIIAEAHQFGVPVLAQIQARGGQIVDEQNARLIGHCIRLGGELGADVVAASYSGDAPSFAQAVAACPVPVLTTGVPRQTDFSKTLALFAQALDCGAAGLCVGAALLQDKNPDLALDTLIELVRDAGETAAGK